MSQPLVHITTFGCQMNTYDSSRLMAICEDLGFRPEADPAKADLILINTCSVREKPVHKVYSVLGSLKHIKRKRPEVILGVAGCVAQQEGRKLLDQVPYLDLVMGPRAIEDLPRLLQDAAAGKRRSHTPEESPILGMRAAVTRQPGLQAMVTVMQGCDNFCSYCVVALCAGAGKKAVRPVR